MEMKIDSGGYKGKFREAFAPIHSAIQFVGILPVVGATNRNVHKIRFDFFTFRVAYAILLFVIFSCELIITIVWTLKKKIEFSKITSVIYWSNNAYILIAFLFLAYKWPQLIRKWDAVEDLLPKLDNRWMMFRKIQLTAVVVMGFATIEHILSIIQGIPRDCAAIKDPYRAYYLTHEQAIFSYTEFTPVKGFIVQFARTVSAIIWNFMDCFVMLIGIGLSAGFAQINNALAPYKGKNMDPDFWAKHRINYRKMCELVDSIDDAIGPITIVSFSNNLFFICTQLLNSFNTEAEKIKQIYFWFSLIFLIVRTLAVSLFSAEINDESKKPKDILRAVPKASWGLETKRFSEEIDNDIVALTGLKFFRLTRGLVLSVAGTIVTYELVLLQFGTSTTITDNDPCNPGNDTIAFSNTTLVT